MFFENAKELDFSLEENKKKLDVAFSKVMSERDNVYPLIINGEKVFRDARTDSINPAEKKQILGYVSLASTEDAHNTITCAEQAFQSFRLSPIKQRAKYISLFVEKILQNRFELIAWLVLESGKSIGEADGEICEAIDFCNAYCLHMNEIKRGVPLIHDDVEVRTCHYHGIGVGVAITPWNFPFSLAAGMAVAGILAGNSMVLKPSGDTPIIAYKLVEMLVDCGIPNGVVNFLCDSPNSSAIGEAIVTHPKTRFINFTGSRDVGLKINRVAAKTSSEQVWIKRVVAEMGGKNATIVDSSADLDAAARGVCAAAFHYQGQKCSACSRVVVMDDIYDEFISKLIEKTSELSFGEGRLGFTCGPVINQTAFDRICKYIETGKAEGKLLYGGESDDSKGFFIKPVIIEAERSHVIAKEEIFGPVLAVLRAKDIDEAIEIANDTEYGLTGSLFSKNPDNISKAKINFFVGNLYINRRSTGAVVLQHPFGGYNMSGTATKTGTKDYILNFMQLKSIAEKTKIDGSNYGLY